MPAPIHTTYAAVSDVLKDGFGRTHTYLRLSVTERCNLRCAYCMPAEGVTLSPREGMLTAEEIERLARLFVSLGVNKIRLTGGEPLVRKGIEELAGRIGDIQGLGTLALTTNGLLLREKLPALRAAGITHLNISLDTLRAERFERITRRKGHAEVCAGIEAALASGVPSVKINCVVMRGINEDELPDFAAMAQESPLEVRFIEYMPFAGNGWSSELFVPFAEMRERIEASFGPLRRLHDASGETSRTYAAPGFRGRIGFITSMSDHFCATCNRLRLTADGSLKVCLFGSAEVSLRDPLRDGASDSALTEIIRSAVAGKAAAHAGLEVIAGSENRPMILIGG